MSSPSRLAAALAAGALAAGALAAGVLAGTAAWGALPAGTSLRAHRPPGATRTERPAGPLSGLTPAQVVATTRGALAGSPELVLAGTLHQGKASVSFSFASSGHGTAAEGHLDSHNSSLGFVGAVDFVERSQLFYLRGSAAFWQYDATRFEPGLSGTERQELVSLLAGRWITFSGTATDSVRTALGSFTNPVAFAKALLSPSKLGTLQEGQPTTYRHRRALPVTSSKGGTLYVALTGPPRPLGVTGTSAGQGGTILFGYPGALSIAAPAGAETLQQLAASLAGTTTTTTTMAG